jgi:Icc-related predicted phosphoesterase
MKILAFSDLHCDISAARSIVAASAQADVVVGAGDFGIRGERSEEALDVLAAMACPFVLVSGNHDSYDRLKRVCGRRNGFYLLQGSTIELAGISFLGLGGEVPRRGEGAWNETFTEQAAARMLEAEAPYRVLVTHTPPYGVADLQADGTHEGSNAIRSAIESARPQYCFCGHIHHSFGKTGVIGSTEIVNLGPVLNWFTV